MTDRECLLIAYGALKSLSNCSVSELIEEHLFPPTLGIFKDPKAIEMLSAVQYPPNGPNFAQFAPKDKSDKVPSSPGDYRLKRTALGNPGDKLSEITPKRLIKQIALWREHMKKGPVHPSAVEDIEAAELYLNDTHAEAGK